MRSVRNRRRTLLILAAILVTSLVFFGVGIRQLFRFARAPVYRLQMVTDPVPNRQVLARRLASESRKHQLEIELSLGSHPSLEVLRIVDSANQINLAMVPGGVGGSSRFPNVRQVAALGIDPLHVMVKPELYDAAARSLAALRGKRINCGPRASVLRILVEDVLRFAGLHPPSASTAGDYQDEATSSQDLLAFADAISAQPAGKRPAIIAKLPDAILFLSPLPSLLARKLVATAGYRLIPLGFSEAYTLDRLNLDNAQSEPTVESVDRASIVATLIPPDIYGTDPPVPETPCRTLGTRLLMVAHARTDPEAIARLLQVLYESPFTGLMQPLPLREQVPQFEVHPGTELYLRRSQPFLTPEMMSQLGRLLGGLGAFVSGMVGLYGFLRILQLRKFEAFYHEVRRIVQIGRGQAYDAEVPTEPVARRAYLLDRLDELKSEAIREFAEGGLKGEGLLSGIVALINDTRNSLATPVRASLPESSSSNASGIRNQSRIETG
jgi:hypothetical protein